MKTYYKVITSITDTSCRIYFDGEVVAEECPVNTCVETPLCDIYADYFDTPEEAKLFIRTQKCKGKKITVSRHS